MNTEEINAELSASKSRAFAHAKRIQRAKRSNWLVYESYLAATEESGNETLAQRARFSKPRLRVWTDARRIRVSIPDDETRMHARARALAGVGKRAACSGFSGSSRRRMFERLSTVKRSAANPLFITLTLPREFNNGAQDAKAHLRALFKRWARRWDCAALWKMEPQADGTAHFHLLLWGVSFFPWQTLAVEWAEVLSGAALPRDWPQMSGSEGAQAFRAWAEKNANAGTRKALQAATRVEAIKTWRGVASYAAKYCGKPVETMEDGAGRFWGIMGREFFPDAPEEVEIIEYSDAYRVIQWLRRKIRARRGWEPWVEKVMTLITETPFEAWRVAGK